MFPILGIIGTCIAILGMSLITERVSRPVILWFLGRQVYHGLTELVGKETADEVAKIYSLGRSISGAQLYDLIEQGGFQPTTKSEPIAQ